MGFKGNIIKAKRTLPTKESASGVWKIEDVAEAKQRDEWPDNATQRDAYAANTPFIIKADGNDGGNNDVRGAGAFINVSNHNAGTGFLDNQGPSAKDTYHFKYFQSVNNGYNQDQKTSHENPFEKEGYYSYKFNNSYVGSRAILNVDTYWSNRNQEFYWGSAEGCFEFFAKSDGNVGETEATNNQMFITNWTSSVYGNTTEQTQFALQEEVSNNRRICFSWGANSTNVNAPFITSEYPHRGRGWYHVCVTRDESESNSRFRLFINGMLAGTNTRAKGDSWGGYDGSYSTCVGDALGAQGSYHFRGYMSNLRSCKTIPSEYVTTASVVGTHCFDPPFDRLTPNSQGASSCSYLGLNAPFLKNSYTGWTDGFESKNGHLVTATPTHEVSNWRPLEDIRGNSWTGTWNSGTKTVGNCADFAPEVRNYSPFHGEGKTFTLQLGSATGVAQGTGYCFETEFGSVGSAFVGETITMWEGHKYYFDQDHSSNQSERIAFSITEDGVHGGGVEYTDFVSAEGTPGQSAAFTCITIPSGFTTNIAPRLYYYSAGAPGRGGKIQIGKPYVPKSDTLNYGSETFEPGTIGYRFYSGMETGLYDPDRTKAFMFSAREAYCFEGWWKWERGNGLGFLATNGLFGAYNYTGAPPNNTRNLIVRFRETTANPNFSVYRGDTSVPIFDQDLWRNNPQEHAPICLGQWYHIVFCRGKPLPGQNQAVHGIFINGRNINDGQATLWNLGNNHENSTYHREGFALGVPHNNSNLPFAQTIRNRRGNFPNHDGNAGSNNVKVSNFRYVRGHSVYNPSADSIYIPSSPLAVYTGIDDANTHTQSTADGTSTVVLTFQTKNDRRSRGITDKSPQQRSVQVGAGGGNQHIECGMGRFSPFIKPYGYWSAYFRQNSYLEPTKNASSTLLDGVNGDDTFTIEAWIMYTAPSITTSGNDDQFNYIIAKGLGTNIGKGLGVTTDGKLRFIYYSDTTASHVIVESAAGLIKFGPWYHVAVSNAAGSGNLKLFLDGQQVASGTYGATSTQNGGVPRIAMGDYNNRNSQGFTGYISNLRLSNSTRYTGSFRRPDKPFVDDANTTLLCLNNYRWTDGSSNNSIFNFPFGSPQVNPMNPFMEPTIDYDPDVHGSSWYLRNNHSSASQFTPLNDHCWFVETIDQQMEPERADYTMECWLYHEGNNWSSDSQVKGGRPGFHTNGTGGNLTISATDVPEHHCHPFTWNHLVVQKEQHSPATSTTGSYGNVCRFSLYLNGNRVYENTSWPLRQYNNSDRLYFGRNIDAVASRVDIMHMGETGGNTNKWFWFLEGTSYGGMRGYISDIRYIKGKNTFPASKTTYDVPTKPTTVDAMSQFHLDSSGAAIPNVRNNSNIRTVFQAQAAQNIPAKFGSGCMYFPDDGLSHISTPLDINNCMERCSFTIEGFVKFELIYRAAVAEPDAKQAIGSTAQQELGFFHIIDRGDNFNNNNNGLGLRLSRGNSFVMSYGLTGTTVAENVVGQPEQAAGNSAMHTYNTDVLAEADFASDDETEAFVRDGKDMPRYHRRDERNTKAPWYHFVVCRDATLATNNLVFYWNGKKKLFATDSTNYPLTHPFLKIGAQFVATNCLSGWMDNFRVTKGICRYDVTQDTITVPTEDFPEF